MTETDYTARDITVLEGLEPVRLRPGMYIGSTGLRGLHHLITEVVDNSVDEALAGRNDRIEVTLHPDHSVTVQDWGSGIPTEVMPEQGLPALTVSTGLVGQTPVGVQIVAGRYREDLCLRAGEAIEARGTPPAPIDPRN